MSEEGLLQLVERPQRIVAFPNRTEHGDAIEAEVVTPGEPRAVDAAKRNHFGAVRSDENGLEFVESKRGVHGERAHDRKPDPLVDNSIERQR